MLAVQEEILELTAPAHICKVRCDVCTAPTETRGSVGLAGPSLSPMSELKAQ